MTSVFNNEIKIVSLQASNGDVQEDIPEAMRLLVEMNSNVNQVTDLVETMIQKVKSGEISTEHGISFLTVKYHMLLNYLINLTYVVLRKCSGKLLVLISMAGVS